METEEQLNNTKPWLFQPGVSGNPGGRPKGSKSLKTFVQEMLRDMDDEEKVLFLKGLPKAEIWKMAEGNPKQDTDVTSGGEKIKFEIINYGENNTDSVRIPAENVPTESTEVQSEV